MGIAPQQEGLKIGGSLLPPFKHKERVHHFEKLPHEDVQANLA